MLSEKVGENKVIVNKKIKLHGLVESVIWYIL